MLFEFHVKCLSSVEKFNEVLASKEEEFCMTDPKTNTNPEVRTEAEPATKSVLPKISPVPENR